MNIFRGLMWMLGFHIHKWGKYGDPFVCKSPHPNWYDCYQQRTCETCGKVQRVELPGEGYMLPGGEKIEAHHPINSWNTKY